VVVHGNFEQVEAQDFFKVLIVLPTYFSESEFITQLYFLFEELEQPFSFVFIFIFSEVLEYFGS